MSFWVRIWLLAYFLSGWFSPNNQLDLVRILSPKDGDVLQGNVVISGTVTGVGLQYADISFQYQDSTSSEWFLIEQINQVIIDDSMINWETSSVADGNYRLRILAQYSDGHQLEAISQKLRIRNYTTIETLVVTPSGSLATPGQLLETSSVLLSPTAIATATEMPKNELSLTFGDMGKSAMNGAITGVLLLVVLGLWLIIRGRRLG